jgi:hypothetical protein
MPRKTFTAGEVLAAADVNTFLMDQSVMTFADSDARGSAIGTATEGMLTYLEDTNAYEYWDGTAYEPLVSAGGGEWISFTPTWSGLTVGNGTYTRAAYNLVGKTVDVHVRFNLGSTSAVTGGLILELPVDIKRKNASSNGVNTVFMFDAGVANYIGIALAVATDDKQWFIRFHSVGGTKVLTGSTSSTEPFTWGNTDIIDVSLSYEVA